MNETDEKSERLRALEKENHALRQQLEERPEVDEDLYAYRIFVEARRKLVVWIGGAAVLLTIFGIYSWNDVVRQVQDQLKEKGTEEVIKDVTTRFVDEHRGAIEESVLASLEEELINQVQGKVSEIVARVEDGVRTEIDAVRTEIAAAVETADAGARPPKEVFEQVRAGRRYFVIAGSSPRELDLTGELRRVRNLVGGDFDNLFPGVQVYPPYGNNTNYALVIGAGLSFEDANTLKQSAIKHGFRKDTFLWKAESASFAIAKE